MKKVFSKSIYIPTTIQEYRFECPAFINRLKKITEQGNGQIIIQQLSEIKKETLRSKAKALFDLFAQSGAILWTLLDMPLTEFGTDVRSAIELLSTDMYRKCALDMFDKWELFDDITDYIETTQVFPLEDFERHVNNSTMDRYIKKYGVNCYCMWNPRKETDENGREYII